MADSKSTLHDIQQVCIGITTVILMLYTTLSVHMYIFHYECVSVCVCVCVEIVCVARCLMCVCALIKRQRENVVAAVRALSFMASVSVSTHKDS